MAYRGGDLDLRTPRTWSVAQADPSPAMAPEPPRGYGGYAPGPIWVDEVVLACVNHAYDVALAHRAGEVRLEHLLHALTRIDTAAEALEARGVRVAALRRESATVIASDLPVGLTNGKSMPRHSEELEHVLRAASLIASRRNAPATVDDVLHLILDVEPDLPGLSLLARVNPRAPLASEPMYTRAAPPMDPRYSEPQRPAPVYYSEPVREPAPQPVQAPRASRPDYGGTAVDSIQNSRLDALEQMVRALSADLGAERKTFSSMLQDLQRDVGVQREEASRLGSGLADSLQGLLATRFNSLEQSVALLRAGSGVDIGPVADRVATIERTVSAGLEQFALSLSTLENDLRRRVQPTVDLQPVTNRLDIIEEAVLSRDGERLVKDLAQRLEKIEQALAVERTHQAEAGAALRGEIGVLTQAVEKQRSELQTSLTGSISDRIGEAVSLLESRQVEAAQSLGSLGQRLIQLEQIVSASAQKLLESEGIGREELGEMQDALVKLNANQHTLAGSLEQWRTEGRQTAEALRTELRASTDAVAADVKSIGPKFVSLEGEAQRVAGLVDGLSGTVEKMHRVTVERYHRRNRFWYWLFGTDDWVAASWPSQTQRIAEELRAVKAQPGRRA